MTAVGVAELRGEPTKREKCGGAPAVGKEGYMEFWKSLLAFCEAKMQEPSSFGWYHLMWVGIIAVFTVLMCIKFRNCSDKTLRIISLTIFVTLVLFDLYKQITYDFVDYDAATNSFVWDYSWYSFPFQLCSSPHYVLPFIIWLPEGKVRDAFIGFMSFFSFVGGFCVFVYPESCLTPYIGVNIQTMLHHGMQITLGVLYAVHERDKFGIKYFLRSVPVFLSLLTIAQVANVVVYHVFTANGISDTFNMFYISPYFECTLPVLSDIYNAVPYPVFFLGYLFAFLLAGFLVYTIMHGFIKIPHKKEAVANAKV